MKHNTQFLGIAGLIVLIFGLITSLLIVNDVYLIAPTHLVAGALMILTFAVRGGLQRVGSAAVKRAAGFGAGVTLYSGLFVGILVLVNYVANRHEFLHFDSTEQKIFTLAPQTRTLVEGLKEPVLIRAFYVRGEVDVEVEGLLDRITRASDNLRWAIIDPEKRPGLVEKFGISESGTLHFSFEGGESAREAKVSREITEQEVVNALLKLTRGGEKKVYVLQGHGEPDIESDQSDGLLFLKEAIQGENLKVAPLMLLQLEEVPEDATALLVFAPKSSLLAKEREAILRYLRRGGSAMFLHDPRTTRDIAELVAPLGIKVGDDVVVDQVVRLFAGPGLGVEPVITTYVKHPITESFDQGTVLSIASSVWAEQDLPEGAVVSEYAFTSDQSWAEKNIELLFGDEPKAALEPDDTQGPISVAAAFEGTVPGSPEAKEGEQRKQSRIVVVGDSDFIANVNIRKLFNRDFFLNSLNWVIGDDQGITIRARTLRRSAHGITAQQMSVMFLLTGVLFPELVLLGGFAVWWSRKS